MPLLVKYNCQVELVIEDSSHRPLNELQARKNTFLSVNDVRFAYVRFIWKFFSSLNILCQLIVDMISNEYFE